MRITSFVKVSAGETTYFNKKSDLLSQIAF